jgi:hypothetical protein
MTQDVPLIYNNIDDAGFLKHFCKSFPVHVGIANVKRYGSLQFNFHSTGD